eukprot:6181501-Pleurochrysis_carterae.AAC.3
MSNVTDDRGWQLHQISSIIKGATHEQKLIIAQSSAGANVTQPGSWRGVAASQQAHPPRRRRRLGVARQCAVAPLIQQPLLEL